ncbi:MAG: hypothetical protein IPQ07_24035 [Myxococcales bacterium]|nr:hypothetical protein [Myxococcales bacterium]
MSRWQLPIIALVMFASAEALACSGPGAMEAIEAAERRGWIMFAITAGIVGLAAGLALRRRRIGTAISMLPVLLIHPAMWFGARHGDCGHLLRDASSLYLVIAPVACAALYRLGVVRARRAADPGRV